MSKYLFFAVVLLLLSCSGCCTLRRSRTITTTITKIDTVIIVKRDTVPLVTYVPVHDTAYLENSTATARSYYDTTLKKIALVLTGKVFSVPVVMTKTETVKEKVTERKTSLKFYIGVGLLLWFITICILIYQRFKK
jgi:hypothetical protein